ncbi:unnamed protein product, partial [marine sediment metagenome]
AAHLEPEILLVDEVLAVGDAAFQKKCLGKMGDVATEGRTVLFVSHNMAAINQLCPRTLWLEAGHLQMDGDPEQVISSYLTSSSQEAEGQRLWTEGIANPKVNEFKIQAVRIRNEHGEVTTKLNTRESFWVEINYHVLEPLPFCHVGLIVSTAQGVIVFDGYDADNQLYAGSRDPGSYTSRCKIPGHLLNSGRYLLSINAGMARVKNLVFLENVLILDIEHISDYGSHKFSTQKRKGVIHPKLQWERKKETFTNFSTCAI